MKEIKYRLNPLNTDEVIISVKELAWFSESKKMDDSRYQELCGLRKQNKWLEKEIERVKNLVLPSRDKAIDHLKEAKNELDAAMYYMGGKDNEDY